MTNGKEYYKRKLTHPDWQKKRLKILERDGFKCLHCGSGKDELHVHHTYYQSGREPWDYPDHCLMTLCYQCHEVEENEIKRAIPTLISFLQKAGFDANDFDCASTMLGCGTSETFRHWFSLWNRLILIKGESPEAYDEIMEKIRFETEQLVGETISPI